MFGKKKTIEPEIVDVPIQAMPADFYGGANPVVKFKTVEHTVQRKNEAAPLLPEKEFARRPELNASGGKHPAKLFSNRKFLAIGAAAFFILFVGGATWYYWRQATKGPAVPATAPAPAPSAPAAPAPTPAPEPEQPAPPAPVPEPTPPTLSEAKLEFPSTLLGDSADSDRDGLSNVTEELFGTDPEIPDTDLDGYADGVELFNLYSPREKAPAKLIDSSLGLVNDFDNPMFGYKIYYPNGWAVGNVDQDYRDVLFSTITGENIEVRVVDKQPGEKFVDWFARMAPSEQLGSLQPFDSVFKVSGRMRGDKLVYYFEDSARVYTVIYHVTDSGVSNYRAVIGMIARSFRLTGTNAVIPVQEIEGATTTPAGEPPAPLDPSAANSSTSSAL